MRVASVAACLLLRGLAQSASAAFGCVVVQVSEAGFHIFPKMLKRPQNLWKQGQSRTARCGIDNHRARNFSRSTCPRATVWRPPRHPSACL